MQSSGLDALEIAGRRCDSGDPSRQFQDMMDTFRLLGAAIRVTLEALRAEGRVALFERVRTLAGWFDSFGPVYAELIRAEGVSLSASEMATLFALHKQTIVDWFQIRLLGADARLCRTVLELPLSMRNLAPEL